jgi:hypothetical protein
MTGCGWLLSGLRADRGRALVPALSGECPVGRWASGMGRVSRKGQVMADVVYRSEVHIERGTGALRYATVPAEKAR